MWNRGHNILRCLLECSLSMVRCERNRHIGEMWPTQSIWPSTIRHAIWMAHSPCDIWWCFLHDWRSIQRYDCKEEVEFKDLWARKHETVDRLGNQLPQQRHTGCVQIDAHETNAFHDHFVQGFRQQFLTDVMLIHSNTQMLGVNFHQFGQRITQTAGNRNWKLNLN